MKKIISSQLEKVGFQLVPDCQKYNTIGETYAIENEYMDGFYWFFCLDPFVVNIHDFKVKKDYVFDYDSRVTPRDGVSLSMIKMGNGETLSPYHSIEKNSILVYFYKDAVSKFLLHGGFPYFSIGFEFKGDYLEHYLTEAYHIQKTEMEAAFRNLNRIGYSVEIETITNEVLEYREAHVGAELFYRAKAQEVLSHTLDLYFKGRQSQTKIDDSDQQALTDVKRYINDHYAMDISQELLCKIAMMSKTKLKDSFKSSEGMTITEYIQRRRIAAAEHMILATDLSIGDVAKSVGYKSHSRFSTLFKRYKGMFPREFKNMIDI